jgi:hypothetical protein
MARFAIAIFDKDVKNIVWQAENEAVEGQFLVAFDFGLAVDDKLPERYKDALLELTEKATARQDLSERMWLFSADLSLNQVFQIFVNNLGVEHHCYSVTELATGEGLAYNAKRRVVYEISGRT